MCTQKFILTDAHRNLLFKKYQHAKLCTSQNMYTVVQTYNTLKVKASNEYIVIIRYGRKQTIANTVQKQRFYVRIFNTFCTGDVQNVMLHYVTEWKRLTDKSITITLLIHKITFCFIAFRH